MQLQRERLDSLIEFAKESANLKTKPICDLKNHKIFHEYEHSFQGLPGVRFNTGGSDDEIWLVVDRLKETSAPTPKNSLLALWLDVSNNPVSEPLLKIEIDIAKLLELNVKQKNESPDNANNNTLLLFKDFDRRQEVESQFKAYLVAEWAPWAIAEQQRRRTIHLYGKLFALKQQVDDAQIETVWGGGIGVWNLDKAKICYPLLTRLVEISINDSSMAIEIRPRDQDPRLELDIYIAEGNPGTKELEVIYKKFMAGAANIFSPFDSSTYDGVLRSAVSCLDPNGIYWPIEITADNRNLPPPTDVLKVTDTWVLFARPRSKNLFVQDLERFQQVLQSEQAILPKAMLAVLTEPANEIVDRPLSSYRGISMVKGTDGNQSLADLYFPMPFNEEQVRIVQMLEQNDGVVVQGPPGTGKTHTIVNIIAHYLALGKRVLVTSMKEPALAVLRDKLPDEISPLAISLLSNEKEGLKQFRHSIEHIATEIQRIDRHVYRNEIVALEQNINGLHGTLARIDRAINEWAKKILGLLFSTMNRFFR